MSGRFGNGRGGQVGCGRGRRMSTPKTNHTNNTVEDYFFFVGSSKQASDYEITAEFVVSPIKNTIIRGNGVSDAFQLLFKLDTNVWKPTINIRSDSYVNIKER